MEGISEGTRVCGRFSRKVLRKALQKVCGRFAEGFLQKESPKARKSAEGFLWKVLWKVPCKAFDLLVFMFLRKGLWKVCCGRNP